MGPVGAAQDGSGVLSFNVLPSHNTSVRVKELLVKMPSFDAESGCWTPFIQYFDDMVIEMGWEV